MRRNPRLTADRAEFVARAWTRDDDEGVRLAFDPRHRFVNPVLYRREEAEACWARVQCPMLFIAGESSGHQERRLADFSDEFLKRVFRDVQIVALPGLGHMMHHEDPAAVARTHCRIRGGARMTSHRAARCRQQMPCPLARAGVTNECPAHRHGAGSPMRTLLIGGARSGKSALAQRWSSERSANVCTLVTGTESDPEMAARIAAHRRDRPSHWRVREEPIHLGRALREEIRFGPGGLPDPVDLQLSVAAGHRRGGSRRVATRA